MDEDDGWRRHLQCVVCLEFTAAPVRPMHWPPEADCGVVFCAPCFARWSACTTKAPMCPRCRADLADVAPRHDALLARILRDCGVVDQAAASAASAAPAAPAAPPVAAFGPVDLGAMHRCAARWESDDGLLPADAAGPLPASWWSDTVVTSTTLVVDDREAECLGRRGGGGWSWSLAELDARLGWSARLQRCTGEPWSAEALLAATGTIAAGANVRVASTDLMPCRVAVATLAAVGTWRRTAASDNNGFGGRLGRYADRTRALYDALRQRAAATHATA